MLEAKDVNFAYMRGQPVIKDMDCKIEDGEFVALLGHNGSGKTTLSRLFMALCHPRSGQVFVDGEDIVKREPADLADKIGYVFQNPDLQILEDTVFDEVAYGPRAKKLTEATIERQVNEALEAMGLTELKGEYPRLLSFGQKRRLGVAAALALNPRTLILDEITNGQDALEKEAMMSYLQAMRLRMVCKSKLSKICISLFQICIDFLIFYYFLVFQIFYCLFHFLKSLYGIHCKYRSLTFIR